MTVVTAVISWKRSLC